jgi:predicted branched-subunit amino acid permease
MRSLSRTIDREDLRDAVALAAAIALVGASFGALAATARVPLALTMALSLLVFAGGSQFLVVAVVAAGGGAIAAVASGLLINARHVPFGLAVGGNIAER